jgi:hypothetical protein
VGAEDAGKRLSSQIGGEGGELGGVDYLEVGGGGGHVGLLEGVGAFHLKKGEKGRRQR